MPGASDQVHGGGAGGRAAEPERVGRSPATRDDTATELGHGRVALLSFTQLDLCATGVLEHF